MAIASSSSLALLRRFRYSSQLGPLSRSRCLPSRRIDVRRYGFTSLRDGSPGYLEDFEQFFGFFRLVFYGEEENGQKKFLEGQKAS
ncbi:hypothetical protein QJS04_geneDACA011768 [Acorus gramineus]|uniref:Uncharacterized protein n=1 Tax=Acorus gramineus TaxID=55184 RepID=A0AAV9BGN3_ACOGR|nr:hypothetical protein QJS04_geneDACA011768 [Acorus gramineus]